MIVEIESRHSDYGPDAGGYSVLRVDGVWVGRIEGPEARQAVRKLIEHIHRLESVPFEWNNAPAKSVTNQ
jgi:phage FluMu protein gp41